MNAVVDDLLAGRTPPGFDDLRAQATARVLAGKRIDAMAFVRPEIVQLPRWRSRAVEFVQATPNDRCAHWDWHMFVEWVRARPEPDDGEWVARMDRLSGRSDEPVQSRGVLQRLASWRRSASGRRS